MRIDYLNTPQGRRLAYSANPSRTGLTFVWLTGFKSDISGTKVASLRAWTQIHGHGFLAFDYSGHGRSGGAFEDATLSDWREDALAAIEACSSGPLVLVGSSMGGWIALLCALQLGRRVRSLLLVAPAPDFTEKLMWPELTKAQQIEILQDGVTLRSSAYGKPYLITRALIEDGARWSLLDAPIAVDVPVRILQGMQDEDVPWEHALRLTQALISKDIVMTLVKDGDHRLSREDDIARLLSTCAELST